jgi:hypothetical protein
MLSIQTLRNKSGNGWSATTMAMPNCDVCGQPAKGVASSTLGAISFAFCQECLNHSAEPEFMFYYLYDDVSHDGEGLSEHINDLSTWKDGRYWEWPEWLAWRKAQGPSKPCEPPPPLDTPADFSLDAAEQFDAAEQKPEEL